MLKHLDKDNLHHAYLIEGKKSEILPELFLFLKDLGVATLGNPDFTHIDIDNFKMNEALSLRSMSTQKSFSGDKRVFVLSINNFSTDAQNAMLKMFEEPNQHTHFFVIVPEINVLIHTLVSRFYLIKNQNAYLDTKEVEDFLNMKFNSRIEFFKELLEDAKDDDDDITEDKNRDLILESKRSKALNFLNILESVLHNKIFNINIEKDVNKKYPTKDTNVIFFDNIFKARKYIRQPGSSVKSILESIALSIPEKI
ncbi:MAG: hypothetical protein M3P22_01005 [bacterium]|nr:hypothetical protein [bacterium]